MSDPKFIKISSTGEQLPADAKEWDAVLLPAHGLTFSAVHVAENVSQEACVAACKALTLCGTSDWDLPTIDELSLVIDRTRHDPAIDPSFFRGIESDWYWSTTPAAWSSASAWFVHFGGGHVGSGRRDGGGFALAVRRPGQSL